MKFWPRVCGPAAADIYVNNYGPPKAIQIALGWVPAWGYVDIQGLSRAGPKPLFGSRRELAWRAGELLALTFCST